MTRLSTIQTPSQTWAKQHNACLAGRRRMGRLSLWEYFHSPYATGSDLIWAVKQLEAHHADAWWHNDYLRACNAAHRVNHGRWAVKRVRDHVLSAMRQYDVRWPVHLL